MNPRRVRQLLRFDRKLLRYHQLNLPSVAGLDEVGRGPLAGPVVSCAIILRELPVRIIIDDSKRLTPLQREKAFRILVRCADIGIGAADHEEIDRMGIHRATGLSMVRALERLPMLPKLVLVDGPWIPHQCPTSAHPIVSGDSKSFLIAAASVVAKVVRDRCMRRLHRFYPSYGFFRHKGYATEKHMRVLRNIGPSPFHRFTFDPLKTICSENADSIL